MNRRTIVLSCILVGLIGVSIFVWKNSQGEESSDVFNNDLAQYTCPSCNQSFTMTGAESVAAQRSEEGIVCPHCGKPLDRPAVLAARRAGDANSSDDAATDTPGTYDEPVSAGVGTMRRPGKN